MKIKFTIKEKPHILWLYWQYNYNIWGLMELLAGLEPATC